MRTAILAMGVAMMTIGCGANDEAWLQAPAVPAELTDFAGHDGLWLTNDAIEVFVSVRPKPRVLAIRPAGGTNLLATHLEHFSGIRTWFMEPNQIDASGNMADSPAELVLLEPGHIRLRTAVDPEAKLQLGLDISLAPDAALLTIRHVIANGDTKPRRVNTWAVAAFPKSGQAITPFFGEHPTVRPITYWHYADPKDKALTIGRKALMLNADWPRNNATKFGVCTDTGWMARLLGQDVLVFRAAFEPEAEYPEGGSNITLFTMESDDPAGTWLEVEHVGPMKTLQPGQSTVLDQQIEYLRLADIPQAEPDALRKRIEAQSRLVDSK